MQIEVATILGDATIQDAAALMRYEGVRSLLVVPRRGNKYGIITFSDVVYKVIAEGLDPRRVTVDEIAVPQAHTISPEISTLAIARFFREKGIGHAPVINAQGELLGVVSMTDLVTETITEPD